MLRRWIYYLLKPYIPWYVRNLLRGTWQRRQRQRYAATWPILPSAGKTPSNWQGWPGKARFAFIITHDVEGAEGYDKTQKLAEIEQSLGLHSSFNFIPEGGYTLSREMRTWLKTRDFEVGVHDLHHDGKLFQSAEGFSQKAARINHYLKEWDAVGFRAGFMLRNFEWYHQLELEYDASSFDTDPFEPQPDGAETIFPFWIPSPGVSATNNCGYVELPYTLAQDSTLFLIMRERDPRIWTHKLDWIVEQGGMALINVHPDYIDFSGKACDRRHYTVELYIQLLRHLKERYAGQFWNPLPRELARWYRAGLNLPSNR